VAGVGATANAEHAMAALASIGRTGARRYLRPCRLAGALGAAGPTAAQGRVGEVLSVEPAESDGMQ